MAGLVLCKPAVLTNHNASHEVAGGFKKRNQNQFWTAASKDFAVETVALVIALTLAPGAWAASTQKVLYSFTGGSDGSPPTQGLILDQAGNL